MRVEVPTFGFRASVEVSPGHISDVLLPVLTAHPPTGEVADHSIRITAPVSVCVYGMVHAPEVTDAFLALPTAGLGTEYVVPSYGGHIAFGRSDANLTVTAAEDGTTVTIVPSADVDGGPDTPNTIERAGDPLTFSLDRGEMIHLRARLTGATGSLAEHDLTGSLITSNKPVAVLSGHDCAEVPNNTQACDYLVEQIPSTDALGDDFLVAPLATREGYELRVVAAHDSTDVSIDGAVVATLDTGEFHSILVEVEGTALHVETSEPALLVQYSLGRQHDNRDGDPFMMLVVPTSQFDDNVLAATVPSEVIVFDNYLTVVIEATEAGGMRVDGSPIAEPFTPIGSTGYAYAHVAVADGSHRLEHLGYGVTFGAYAYGFGNFDSYGYPATMRLSALAEPCVPSTTVPGDGIDNDCDGLYDEEDDNGVDDDGDGADDEDLSFEASATNSTPHAYDGSLSTREDTAISFVLTGFDPDGDPLSYAIASSPSNGTLTGTPSTLAYTPALDYTGTDSFTFTVSDGSQVSAAATFTIVVVHENDGPVISGDVINGVENEVIQVQLVATDDDPACTLTWALTSGFPGMQLDPTGEFFWLPEDGGSYPIEVRTTDCDGATDTRPLTVIVDEVSEPPIIVSTPVRRASYAYPYQYDVDAIDNDTLDLAAIVDRYELRVSPAAMTIVAATGVIDWTPGLGDVGVHQVEVVAIDGEGLESEPQRFSITVEGDDTPPLVTISATPFSVLPGEDVLIRVVASDDDDVLVDHVEVDGTILTLDGSGEAIWTATTVGVKVALAEAVDPSGNRSTAQTNVRVLDASDDTLPVVTLTAPTYDDELLYLHDVVGSVADDNLYRWSVDLRPTDHGAWRTLLQGGENVSGTLGQVDATLLENGRYYLRLRGEDVNGNLAEETVGVRVTGEAKLGLVQMSFVDLALDDIGIPLALVRSYDSRRASEKGDFGYGWELGLRTGRVQHNRLIGEDIVIDPGAGTFAEPFPCVRWEEQEFHFTEVRLSDGEYYVFRPVLVDLQPLSGSCSADVQYEFVDGTNPGAVLGIVGNTTVRARAIGRIRASTFNTRGLLTDIATGDVYNPDHFRLTLLDGRRIDLTTQDGVIRFEDRNGNSLSFTDGAVIHSSGRALEIVRDREGRIDRVRDHAGREIRYQYDSAGDLVGVTNPLEQTTSFEYRVPTHPHHLTDLVDHRGVRIAAMTYTGDGRLDELCDADGVCFDNDYDLVGHELTRYDGLGRPTRHIYTDRGEVSNVIDGLGNVTQLNYDIEIPGRVVSQIDAEGNITRYEYTDHRGNLTARVDPHDVSTDPADFTTTYTYDANNRMTSLTSPAGGSVEFEYDANGNQTVVRDGDGNEVTRTTYDANGRVLTETSRLGTITHEHGDGPEPMRTTDPDGTTWDMIYGADGQLSALYRDGVLFSASSFDSLGRAVHHDFGGGREGTFQYDGAGEFWTRVAGADGVTERRVSGGARLLGWSHEGEQQVAFEYDAVGNFRRETDAAGRVQERTYDDAGRMASQIDHARGATTSVVRDGAGRVTRSTNALGFHTDMTYTAGGRIATMTDANTNTWSFTYTPTSTTVRDPLLRDTTTNTNAYGLPLSILHPDGSSTSVTHLAPSRLEDGDEFVTSETDEMGRVRSFGYDAEGTLVSATDLAGVAWSYGYPEDHVEKVTSPLGRAWRIERTDAGDPSRVVYPDTSETTMTYTDFNELDTMTQPDGNVVTYVYDADRRETSRSTATGESRTITYDTNEAVDTVTNAAGATSYTYDAAGRLETLTSPSGSRIRYEYDAGDRVTHVHTRPSGTAPEETTAYGYDPVGNLTSITDPLGGVTSYTYDAANRPATRTLPNGVITTWTFDLRDRLSSVVHEDSTGTVLASETYTRTLSGEPTQIDREDGTYVEFTYDGALRLTSETYRNASGTVLRSKTYTYDQDGNRLTKNADSYTYGAGFRLDSAGADGFTHDAAGRVTQIARGAINTDLTYDSFDHVTQVDQGGATTDYVFDGEGRRVSVDDGTSSRNFLVAPSMARSYESPHVITDAVTGNQQLAYVFAGEHAVMRYGASGPRYYLRDAMGSIIALTDGAGNRVARIEYDAFGNIDATTGAEAALPTESLGDFRHHGMWRDPTGLYYVRARTYDPETARFTSRDPAAPASQAPEMWSPYQANRSVPTLYRDPSGRVSLIEVQTNLQARAALASAAVRSGLSRLLFTARGGMGNLIRSSIRDFVRGEIIDQAIGQAFSSVIPSNWLATADFGRKFESLVTDELCEMFQGFPGGVRNSLFLEPPLDSSGRPVGNGYSCSDTTGQNTTVPTTLTRGPRLGPTGSKFPDLLFSRARPTNLQRGLSGSPKSYLLTEIKARPETALGKPAQLRTFVRHARRFSYSRMVVLITVKGANLATRQRLRSYSFGFPYVPIHVLSFQGFD